jgi:hypothetical protein
MTTRHPPRLALALLERVVPGSALAGDLIEEYGRRPSRWRVWREVIAAIALAWFERPDEIRPLRLVDLQPSDAIERWRRMAGRTDPVNLIASPLQGISGLGIAVLLLLMTLVAPAAWWLFIASILAGILLGIVMIAVQRSRVG